MCKGRGAYDHAFLREIVVNAAFCYLSCKTQIVIVELLQILVEGYVAGTNLSGTVGNDGVYGNSVVLHQFAVHGKQVELLDCACRPTYAIAHEHIELHVLPAADFQEVRNIKCLEECYHRHGSLHPHVKGVCTGRFFGIYFFHDCLHFYRISSGKALSRAAWLGKTMSAPAS